MIEETSSSASAAEAAALVSDGHVLSTALMLPAVEAAEAAALVSDGHFTKAITSVLAWATRPRPRLW